MKKRLTLNNFEIEIDVQADQVPAGLTLSLNFPLTAFKNVESIPVVESKESEQVPEPIPTPIAEPVQELSDNKLDPLPKWEHGKKIGFFRSNLTNFSTIGNAKDLGLSGGSFTILMRVSFPDIESNQRVIGSENIAGPGSSLQMGILKGGIVWIDTFQGALTGGKIEKDKFYSLGFSMDSEGKERIYIDGVLVSYGQVPTFIGVTDLFLGRWINTYSSFDLEWIRIYDLLSDEDIKKLSK